LPSVSPYIHIYTTLTFLALQGAPHIYDIGRLRVISTYVQQVHQTEDDEMGRERGMHGV
jgi:hypothetical protein